MHALPVVVLIAAGVIACTALAKQLRLSAPLLLVAAGVAVSLIPGVPPVRVSPELVLFVLLPPLLYAAALDSSLVAVRANRRPIGLLAIGLVLVTAVVVAAVTRFTLGSAWPVALALGAVVAPPDAVAATAVARRAGLPRRLVTILEGESLFNDATALVTLRVSIAAAVEGTFSPWKGLLDFAVAGLGGAAIGVLCGLGFAWLRRRITAPLLETAMSLVIPFGVYLLAEQEHTSGVIAVVVTGLWLAHRSPIDLSPAARLTEGALWSTTRLLLEGGVFALIGLQLTDIVAGVTEPVTTVVLVAGCVLAAVLLVRPVWLFGLVYLGRILPWTGTARPRPAELSLLSWAGMRGVVSLAAAQSLPLAIPHRDLLLLVTVVVITGTLGMQGPTLPLLIRRLDVRAPDPRQDALEVAHAQQRATAAAEHRLTQLAEEEDLPAWLVAGLRKQLNLRAYSAWERLGEQDVETPGQQYARLRREMVTAERRVFVELRDSGELEEELLRKVQLRLDLEESLYPEPEPATERGHQEVLPPRGEGRLCAHLRVAPTRVPDADPRECPQCVAEGLTTWVHLRACLTCGQIGCCDSSPRRHALAHFHQTGHPVMGSAEQGEHWRWCYEDQKVG